MFKVQPWLSKDISVFQSQEAKSATSNILHWNNIFFKKSCVFNPMFYRNVLKSRNKYSLIALLVIVRVGGNTNKDLHNTIISY